MLKKTVYQVPEVLGYVLGLAVLRVCRELLRT